MNIEKSSRMTKRVSVDLFWPSSYDNDVRGETHFRDTGILLRIETVGRLIFCHI
jgi:hypothetical protein